MSHFAFYAMCALILALLGAWLLIVLAQCLDIKPKKHLKRIRR